MRIVARRVATRSSGVEINNNTRPAPSQPRVKQIAARTVTLPSDALANRVRYCWGDAPRCSLHDTALPASPFELDVK